MTPEEIRQTLWRTLDKLDELYGDRANAEELLRSEREAHRQEMANLNAEIAAKDRKLAENEARIAALEKELAQSKAANVDANLPSSPPSSRQCGAAGPTTRTCCLRQSISMLDKTKLRNINF